MYRKRLEGEFAGVIIAPLYLYDLLFTAGILTDAHELQTVVFDEVDVFYNIKTIPEFHEFLFHHPSISKANNLIYCSATITPEFIAENDRVLNDRAMRLFWQQFTNNTDIQDSDLTTVQQRFFSVNNEIPNTSIAFSNNKYIYLNYHDRVNLVQDSNLSVELYRAYG